MKTKSDFDVLIIGGGPGGLSAALWCSDLGLTSLVLEENSELGGQLLIVHNPIKNYLGVEAKNGRELRDIFLRQIAECNSTLKLNAKVVDLDPDANTVTLAGGEKYTGRAIVVATGVRRRRLNIPGEVEFAGRGILESGFASKDKVLGKQVIIIGGGDAALENAVILSETAAKVTVVHRRDVFSARSEFVKRAEAAGNVEFIFDSSIAAILGDERVTAVDIKNERTSATLHMEVDAVLIRIGVQPNTELFLGEIKLDDLGYISVEESCETSRNEIFAVGDAANRLAPTISTATGMAAATAKFIAFRFQK